MVRSIPSFLILALIAPLCLNYPIAKNDDLEVANVMSNSNIVPDYIDFELMTMVDNDEEITAAGEEVTIAVGIDEETPYNNPEITAAGFDEEVEIGIIDENENEIIIIDDTEDDIIGVAGVIDEEETLSSYKLTEIPTISISGDIDDEDNDKINGIVFRSKFSKGNHGKNRGHSIMYELRKHKSEKEKEAEDIENDSDMDDDLIDQPDEIENNTTIIKTNEIEAEVTPTVIETESEINPIETQAPSEEIIESGENESEASPIETQVPSEEIIEPNETEAADYFETKYFEEEEIETGEVFQEDDFEIPKPLFVKRDEQIMLINENEVSFTTEEITTGVIIEEPTEEITETIDPTINKILARQKVFGYENFHTNVNIIDENDDDDFVGIAIMEEEQEETNENCETATEIVTDFYTYTDAIEEDLPTIVGVVDEEIEDDEFISIADVNENGEVCIDGVEDNELGDNEKISEEFELVDADISKKRQEIFMDFEIVDSELTSIIFEEPTENVIISGTEIIDINGFEQPLIEIEEITDSYFEIEETTQTATAEDIPTESN